MENLQFYSKVQHEIAMMKDSSLDPNQKRFIAELNRRLYPVAYAGYVPHLQFPFYEFRCYSEFHPMIKSTRFQVTDDFKQTINTLSKEYLKVDDINDIVHISEVGIQFKCWKSH